MTSPRLTLGGKFLLAISPFILLGSIGTAVYYNALHQGQRAFEQSISEEATLAGAAHETANAALRVGVGTLAYLHDPTEDQRQRAEHARAEYWMAKSRYDVLWRQSGDQADWPQLSDAFERFAALSRSLTERQEGVAVLRAQRAALEERWRDAVKRAASGGSPRQGSDDRKLANDLETVGEKYRAAAEPMEHELEEFLQLRDQLDNLLETSHQTATDLTSSRQMAVTAAQKGITFMWIIALVQITLPVAAILLLGRSVRARIERLASATHDISAGDLATRVETVGNDEITELGRHFNQMADQLESTTVSRAELEDREAALRVSDERQRLLVERLKDCAIFMVGANGKITSWNAGAERLYGYSEAEATGAELQTLYAESAEQSAAHHLNLALRSGGYAFEGPQLRRDHTNFWAEVSITPLELAKRLGEYVVLVRDVTVQRAAGLERQRNLDQLAHVGRLSVMGEMAAGFAHELNQPLGAISNYAEGCLIRLADGALPPEVLSQILERISSEAQRAGDIIHRVRAFARKDERHNEEVDVRAAIEHVAALLEHDALHQGVDLNLDLPEDLPSVRGDRVQLEQVLVNLIRNAFDAVNGTVGGPYSRQVSVHADLNEAGDVHVSVEDNGCGIPEGSEAKMFDAFYTTKADGLGMGLAISRTIVESHGGRIWASRNEHRGLTTHVTIPPPAPAAPMQVASAME